MESIPHNRRGEEHGETQKWERSNGSDQEEDQL